MFFPEAADKAFLVREFDPTAGPNEIDVPDPIGQSRGVYFRCRDVLKKALPSLLSLLGPDPVDSADERAVSTASSSAPAASGDASGRRAEYPFGGGQIPARSSDRSPFPASAMQPAANAPRRPTLAETDPEIAATIQAEELRQTENIELIASENFCSRAVREAQGSVFTNKYAEGYPGKRWYGGCENADVVEQLAIDRAKKIFGAEHVNVQPHSGAQANMAVYFSVLQPGDKILTMDLSHGGHLTHGNKANFSGRFYDVVHYGVAQGDERIDYEGFARQAEPNGRR